MASSGLSTVLAMAFEIRTAVDESRSSGFDSADDATNPLWGAPRIHGELLKPGIPFTSSETIARTGETGGIFG
jgi:hypothetical protein